MVHGSLSADSETGRHRRGMRLRRSATSWCLCAKPLRRVDSCALARSVCLSIPRHGGSLPKTSCLLLPQRYRTSRSRRRPISSSRLDNVTRSARKCRSSLHSTASRRQSVTSCRFLATVRGSRPPKQSTSFIRCVARLLPSFKALLVIDSHPHRRSSLVLPFRKRAFSRSTACSASTTSEMGFGSGLEFTICISPR